MTISSGRWNIAAAKAELSRLVLEARDACQPRWHSVLELSAEIREEGGTTLKVPARKPRRSPFLRSRR